MAIREPGQKGRKIQITTEVSKGLRGVVDEVVTGEGLSQSIVVRRALMFYLGTDANGEPFNRPALCPQEHAAFHEALTTQGVTLRALAGLDVDTLRQLMIAAERLHRACDTMRADLEDMAGVR